MSLIIQLDSHPLLLQQTSSSAPVLHSAGTAAVLTFSRLHTGLEVMNDGGGNYCVIACDEIRLEERSWRLLIFRFRQVDRSGWDQSQTVVMSLVRVVVMSLVRVLSVLV